ncbi:MAG: hypothetical protein PHW94_08880 [Sulfurimonas sp.]|nr:hypothetical protein [Sulfurimonas sp.]MDD3061036.1 hypothetical protein [Sulfurimonas sp.]
MKVFLSWSGEQSHKVAVVLRDWFPSVIQSLVPYVSSEDIDKGARWSTDIATELADSTFGILCVTRENLTAPWLTFEAGALSKTMDKSFVCPFLFNIKRSEVDGPILQFQSTIFDKEDIKKLLKTLNKACDGDKLTEERLDKAFEVWYPTLEEELKKIEPLIEEEKLDKKQNKEVPSNEILEEILELSRLNQKLLRSPDMKYTKDIEQMSMMLTELREKLFIRDEEILNRKRRKNHPMFVEELLHISSRFEKNYTGLQITLSLFRNDYPWLYDAGLDLVRILRSKSSAPEKEEAINVFMELIEFTFEHPIMREMYGMDKESHMMGRELRHILMRNIKNIR